MNQRNLATPQMILVLASLCLLAFTGMARLDWSQPAPTWDVTVASWVQSWALPGIGSIMWAVSWPGWSPQSLILVLGICGLLYVRGLRSAAPLALATGLTLMLVRSIKEVVARARPELGLAQGGPLDPSFPSGHATMYTLFLGLLAYAAWRRRRPGWRRSTEVGLCLTFIVAVGPSRVYLGQHWPTDVLAGYLLGGGLMLLIVAVHRWRRRTATSRG